MISDIERLKRIFERMNSDGYDLKNYLKWGFYFFYYQISKMDAVERMAIGDFMLVWWMF